MECAASNDRRAFFYLKIMSKISMFASVRDTKPAGEMEVIDFLNAVKHGRWQEKIEPIRKITDKDERQKAKQKLPACTISGTFTERKQSGFVQHSGFMVVDIDERVDRALLQKDQYTYALFHSASGVGIAVLVKVDPNKHEESYRFIENYYYKQYGISVDPAPKNIASARYVSFDPNLYLNEKSKKSGTKQKPKKNQTGSVPIVLPQNEAEELARRVYERGINLAPDYEQYLKLAFALCDGFGESGRPMFHMLCGVSEKYSSQEADAKYSHCLKNAGKSGGVTVGTFYWMVKEAGVELPKTNNQAVRAAAMAKKSNRPKESARDQLVAMNGLSREQATKFVDEVYSRDDISIANIASDPENLLEALEEFIKSQHPIRKNRITQKLEEKGNEVSKERLNSIFLKARRFFNKKDVTYDLVERLIFSEITPEFHPIQEYIEKNRHRKTTGNIDALARCIRTDTPGHDAFVRRWVYGWVHALQGAPVRLVLTLVGGQKTGKTEFFRRLPPAALRKYYAESKLDAGKDDEILMCQKLWVMDDEMGGKSKQDEKRFKELTSKSTFSLRAPYGRHNEDYKRLAVLCGTSNDESILNDATGNTRILPVRVFSIDHEAYNAIDKDELFMEAVRAVEEGANYELTDQEQQQLDEINGDFESTPFERELIQKFFAPVGDGDYPEYLTATEIKDVIETNTKQRIMSLRKFGVECRNIFGDKVSKRINGQPMKVYRCLPTTLHGRSNTLSNSHEEGPVF